MSFKNETQLNKNIKRITKGVIKKIHQENFNGKGGLLILLFVCVCQEKWNT